MPDLATLNCPKCGEQMMGRRATSAKEGRGWEFQCKNRHWRFVPDETSTSDGAER